jgi:predicted protein tyrosine phosphatase
VQDLHTLCRKLDAKSDLLELTDVELGASKQEWAKIYFVIEQVNRKLPNALVGLGKKRFLSHEEIAALIRNDPDCKYIPYSYTFDMLLMHS